MYHVNPKTGEAGACRAENGKCPFGGPNVHYSSEEAARAAFESSMAGEQLKAVRKRKDGKTDGRALRKNWPDLDLYRGEIEIQDEVFIHPQGKIVIADGAGNLHVFRNGVKAGTSATLEDLRDGRGAWQKIKDSGALLPSSDTYARAYPNLDQAAESDEQSTPEKLDEKARMAANISRGYPATSPFDARKSGNINFIERRAGRFHRSPILPIDERGNPHKLQEMKDGEKLKYWNFRNRTTGKLDADSTFEVWRAPAASGKGYSYKAVVTSGKSVYKIGSVGGFSHDQTGARMGDSWTMVGAFEPIEGGEIHGEVPDRSMPIYTYK